MTIHLSDEAQAQITKLCTDAYDIGIRLEVVSGGCSGYQYKFSKVALVTEDLEKDVMIGTEGAALYIDHQSAEKIDGATIDFEKALMFQNFVVINPNAQCCGCGKSFT
jgi:iron-sulfur cluster insertion protein